MCPATTDGDSSLKRKKGTETEGGVSIRIYKAVITNLDYSLGKVSDQLRLHLKDLALHQPSTRHHHPFHTQRVRTK